MLGTRVVSRNGREASRVGERLCCLNDLSDPPRMLLRFLFLPTDADLMDDDLLLMFKTLNDDVFRGPATRGR